MKRSICFFTCLFFGLVHSHISSAYELGVIAMFYDEAPYLKEWIEYHRMVGVDHFWLFNNGSTDEWEKVLKPYIKKGIVEVDYIPKSNGPVGSHVPLQKKAIRDGISKAKDKAKWVAVIDIDEFIVPKQHKSIIECLEKEFADVSAIYVNWRHFGTSGKNVPLGNPYICELTKCSLKTHPRNGTGKSIVRPNHVNVEKIWYQHHFPLLDGYKYVNADGDELVTSNNDVKTDGKHHDQFLVVNHYALRDEYFYHNVRLKRRARPHQIDYWLESYELFSLTEDFTIIDFIKKNYPQKYRKFWKKANQ